MTLTQKPTVCIKVPKTQGEKTIALACKLGLFDKLLEIQWDGDLLYIPLLRQPKNSELTMIKEQLPDYILETKHFAQKKSTAQTLTQALQGKIPANLMAKVPQALDAIGDIAIIEVPLELKTYSDLIGQAILRTHKNIKTVFAKAGAVGGVYRVRELVLIAGKDKTQSVYREFGCTYHIDVTKAYFSPRLSHEHERVASLVQAGESVVDLFAGVGPFAVLIAKRNPSVKVFAVDLNPDAAELLGTNVRVNRVENRVFPILGDARKITSTKLEGIADRVIMNLPETAIEFVDAACQSLKPKGGIIHFYAFIRQPNTIEHLKQTFSEIVQKANRKVEAFLCERSVRETAPYESQVVLDAKVN